MAKLAAMALALWPRWGVKGEPSRAGAEVSLEALFRAHSDDVRRLVGRLLGPGASRADVEDLVQQVFLHAQRALPRFRGDAKPYTWLYGIATRTVYEELRKRGRHRRMLSAVEAMAGVSELGVVSGDGEARAELARVWRALMKLDAKKRVVFLLHEVEGMSGREIAEALSIKEGTVHTRLHHARRELLGWLDVGGTR